jgi:hypothetical protein
MHHYYLMCRAGDFLAYLCQRSINVFILMVISGRVGKPLGIFYSHSSHAQETIFSVVERGAMHHFESDTFPDPWHYISMIHIAGNDQDRKAKISKGLSDRTGLRHAAAVMKIAAKCYEICLNIIYAAQHLGSIMKICHSQNPQGIIHDTPKVLS